MLEQVFTNFQIQKDNYAFDQGWQYQTSHTIEVS